jgi:hypothetical protein
MPRSMQLVLFCYEALLALYPRELRQKYGPEIVEAFQQDLWTEWSARRARGVLSIVLCALREVFTVAMPGWFLSERTIASALSLLITTTVFVSMIAVMEDRALAAWINHKFLFGCR